MVQRLLVDSDILIDAGRAVQVAVDRLNSEAQTSTLAISAITCMELMVGCRNKTELQTMEQFFSRFELIKLNGTISDRATHIIRSYRLSQGLMIADALIAATAMVTNVPLLSKNQRDYRFIQGLNLLPYP